MTRRWTPRRFVTLRRVRVMACVASLTLTSALAFGVGARKSVALTVNGETTTVTTYAMSVDRLLQEQGVKVKTHDLVESTSPTSMLKNHDVVNVQSAYQTTITIDGQEVPFWTVASSAEQLLDFFNQNGENHRQYQQRLQQAHRRSHHQPEGARHRHRGREKLGGAERQAARCLHS